jgi:thiosulfate dehydrogenase [quinone] large subunit
MGFGTKIGLFVLRLYVGVTFVLAAWKKIYPGFRFANFPKGWLKTEALKGFLTNAAANVRPEVSFVGSLIEKVFVPNAGILTYLVVFGEILVGIGLVLGLLTRTAAIFGMLMTSVFFLATWEQGPFVWTLLHNWAFATMLLCFTILVSGAGLAGGIDGQIRRRA